MPLSMKNKIMAAIVASLLLLLAFIWFSPAGIKQMPDITLTAIDGRKISLREFRGKPLLVTFWATTCPGCIREMPLLVDLHNALGPAGLIIIGIAMYYDPPNQVIKLVKRKQLPYIITFDMDQKAANAFGEVRLTPTNFLIAPDGSIVQQKIGEYNESGMAALKQQIQSMLKS